MVSASLLYLPGCLQDSLSALPLSCPLIPELQITDVTHCVWYFPQGSNLDLKAIFWSYSRRPISSATYLFSTCSEAKSLVTHVICSCNFLCVGCLSAVWIMPLTVKILGLIQLSLSLLLKLRFLF